MNEALAALQEALHERGQEHERDRRGGDHDERGSDAEHGARSRHEHDAEDYQKARRSK